jgi:putative membrane protein
MKAHDFLTQLNWRFLLVRIVVNALALGLTALIVPRIEFVDKSIPSVLLMGVMLGVLNALVKPVVQFITYRFFFATFGLVIVITNAFMLWLLALLFPRWFAVTGLLWTLLGGLVLGLISSFLESLLGLTRPIVGDEPPELRERLDQQTPPTQWSPALAQQEIAEAALSEHKASGEGGELAEAPQPEHALEAEAVEETAATIEEVETQPEAPDTMPLSQPDTAEQLDDAAPETAEDEVHALPSSQADLEPVQSASSTELDAGELETGVQAPNGESEIVPDEARPEPEASAVSVSEDAGESASDRLAAEEPVPPETTAPDESQAIESQIPKDQEPQPKENRR